MKSEYFPSKKLTKMSDRPEYVQLDAQATMEDIVAFFEAEVKSGKWQTRPPQERAKMLNEVQRISENIMLNTAIRRLKLLKKKIKETMRPARAEFYLQDPYNIRQWVEENPALAANLGWGKDTPSFDQLIRDPGPISDDIRVVFATKIRKPADLLNFQQGFSSTVQTPQ